MVVFFSLWNKTFPKKCPSFKCLWIRCYCRNDSIVVRVSALNITVIAAVIENEFMYISIISVCSQWSTTRAGTWWLDEGNAWIERERDKDGSHHANCVPTFTSDYFLQAVEPIKWNGGTGGMCLSVTEDGDRQSETDLKHK